MTSKAGEFVVEINDPSVWLNRELTFKLNNGGEVSGLVTAISLDANIVELCDWTGIPGNSYLEVYHIMLDAISCVLYQGTDTEEKRFERRTKTHNTGN